MLFVFQDVVSAKEKQPWMTEWTEVDQILSFFISSGGRSFDESGGLGGRKHQKRLWELHRRDQSVEQHHGTGDISSFV